MYEMQLAEKYIKEVYIKSAWSKRQHLPNYISYIQNELNELKVAIEFEDKANIREELGDVLMMAFFLFIWLKDNGLVINESSPLEKRNEIYSRVHISELLNNIKVIENMYRQTTNYSLYEIEKNFLEIKTLVYQVRCTMNFSLEDIATVICRKLKYRYPSLFSSCVQMKLWNNYDDEETEWKQQKQKWSLIEYAFCSNPKCDYYHNPLYENFTVIKHNGKNEIKCLHCGNISSLNKSVLLYGVKEDKKKVLKIVLDYISHNDKTIYGKCQYNNKTLSSWVDKCCRFPYAAAKLMHYRFGVEEKYVLDYLQNKSTKS